MKLLFYDSEIPDLLKNAGNPIGGACVRQYAIARGLVQNGYQVGILTWKGAKEYIGRNSFHFDLVESIPRDKGIRVLRVLYLWLPLFYKAIARYRPDYLFQKGASTNTLMMAFLARISKIPFVYMATSNKDGDDRLASVRGRMSRSFYFTGLKMASAIICQNAYQQQSFKKMFPNKKVILMRNPFFLEEGLQPVKPWSQRKYFAWIGNFRTVKNLPAVYEIAKRLPQYEFRIAGTVVFMKSYGDETQEAYEKLKECPNVKFLGHLKREEVIPVLADAYALFNTSHMEGFSNTFLEAFAAGTPIVTREPIDPDGMIARNNLGRIVKTYEEMPDALSNLAQSPDFDVIATNCQQYLDQNHNPGTITSQLVKELIS